MCLQDLAIARRTIVRRTTATIDVFATPYTLAPDPRRLGLLVVPVGSSGTIRAGVATDTNTGVFQWANVPTSSLQVMRIETFGLLVIDTLYLWNTTVAAPAYIIELLADYELDRLIQKETG